MCFAKHLHVCSLCSDEGGCDVILLDEVTELFFQRASLFPHLLHLSQDPLHALQTCYFLCTDTGVCMCLYSKLK